MKQHLYRNILVPSSDGVYIVSGVCKRLNLLRPVLEILIRFSNLDFDNDKRLHFSDTDELPYIALIIDMAKQLWPHLSGVELLHHPDLMPLWWSLALGACLGGNGTAIGASANGIVVGIAERSGNPLSFKKFMLYGMPFMIQTVIISMVYVWLSYYALNV